MKPPRQAIITWAVREEDVTYWLHYADHADLDARARQAVRHLRDSMLRLMRQRDQVDDALRSFSTNAITGMNRPSFAQKSRLFEATTQFFQSYYATLSAWSSLLVRLASRLRLNVPSTSSMKQFIAWLGGRSGFHPLDFGRVEVLESARQFRAIYDHPGQFQPFDWDLFADEIGLVDRIRLFGPSRGSAPEGASPCSGPLESEGGWSFVAPDGGDVADALAELMVHFMPLIAGELRLSEDAAVTCPDFPWEREWNGTRAIYSEPESFYLASERRVDPLTGDRLQSPELSKSVARCVISSSLERTAE